MATELALGVGVLLLPVVFVVLTIPSWSERQTTGTRDRPRKSGGRSRVTAGATRRLANGLAEMMAANLALARSGHAGRARVRAG